MPLKNAFIRAGLLILATASAQAATVTAYTFDSLSAVRLEPTFGGFNLITATGVLAGDSLPGSASFFLKSTAVDERCNKYIDLMIEHPGAYTLAFSVSAETTTVPPATILTIVACGLTLKP